MSFSSGEEDNDMLLQRSTQAFAPKPLRVLCFHGFQGNGAFMQGQVKRSFLGDYVAKEGEQLDSE